MKKKNAMKKILLLLGCLALLTGCAAPVSQSTRDSVPDNGVLIKGKLVTVNEDMESVLADLGEADKLVESKSCKYDGNDKIYTYGDVVITTYPEEGKDYVLEISVRDDSVVFSQDVHVGSAYDALVKGYGESLVSGEDYYNCELVDGIYLEAYLEHEEIVEIVIYQEGK